MKQIFNITHIIICITCIVFPMHLWGKVNSGDCERINTNTTTCAQTAGCHINNGTCEMCPKGFYCENGSTHSCGGDLVYHKNGGVDMLELAPDDVQKYMGLANFEECLTYAQFTLYCPASDYFGQSGTTYKCIACTAPMEDGTIQTATQETGISGAKGTINELLMNYGRLERCLTCGKNAEPDDDGIGCVCKDGYQFIGRSETEVYDNTSCEKKPAGTTCNKGHYVKSGKCEQCPPGTYQAMNNYDGETCEPCDIGYYNNSFGQESCSPCAPGTYQDEQEKTECKKCPTGTYNPNTGSTTEEACIDCVAEAATGISDRPNLTDIYNKCRLYAIEVTDRTSLDMCEYTLTSAQGYYLTRGANTGTQYNFTCNQCPTLTTRDAETITGNKDSLYNNVGTLADGSACSTNCSCDGQNNKEGACITDTGAYRCECIEGYHVENETRDTTYYNPINGQKNCVINEYSIKYYCNDDTGNTKKFTIEYNVGHNILPSDTCQKTGYTFNGWLEEESQTIYTTSEQIKNVTRDYKFTAQWKVKEFNVYYNGNENTGGDKPTKPTTCTYGDETCKAPDNSYMNAGFIFKNWSCQYMPQAGQTLKPCCKTIDSMGFDTGTCEIEPGKDISTISDGNDIILTAIWKSCPNGYYCPGDNSDPETEPQACPAGSTTDAGADSIYDCHMVGGTTRICGDNGCFDLPKGVGELFYREEKEN